METKENIGKCISEKILLIMEENIISKEKFLEDIGRKSGQFNRFIYDIRHGNITLQTIINIANALDVEVVKLFETNKNNKEEMLDMISLLQQGALNFSSGDVVDLPKLLDFMWHSLSLGTRKKIGKEVYNDVISGGYSNIIKLHHKNNNNHAYYEIV
ncbi:MAG: hypothetical protein PWP67_535 [Clostridium butyricum]|jgi:transcriptional regulator with XRE-family HTH domain|nr:hypothetical protein [Clostridium butyricum]